MLRGGRRAAGARFLLGLLVGEVAAGALLGVPAFLLSEGLREALPTPARLWAVAATCAVFGLADLANRTPRVARQVPEALIERLQPGILGLAWGFDLGLLFTTQKAVSLIWTALAAAILLDPPLAAGLTIGISVVTATAVAVQSLWRPAPGGPMAWKAKLRYARLGSGAALLAFFVLTAVQAWNA